MVRSEDVVILYGSAAGVGRDVEILGAVLDVDVVEAGAGTGVSTANADRPGQLRAGCGVPVGVVLRATVLLIGWPACQPGVAVLPAASCKLDGSVLLIRPDDDAEVGTEVVLLA